MPKKGWNIPASLSWLWQNRPIMNDLKSSKFLKFPKTISLEFMLKFYVCWSTNDGKIQVNMWIFAIKTNFNNIEIAVKLDLCYRSFENKIRHLESNSCNNVPLV